MRLLSLTGYLIVFATSVVAGPNGNTFNPAGIKGAWIHYASPHFELYSQASEKRSREVLHRMEMIRSLFLETFRCVESEKKPVTIFYFKDDDALKYYLTPENNVSDPDEVAALMLTTPERSQILLVPTSESGTRTRLVLHQYVHHLVSATGMQLPLWLNEGLAEIYSAIKIGHDKIEIGRPPVDHLRNLLRFPRVPVSILVVRQNYFKTSYGNEVYYGESWALVHYLYFGKNDLTRDGRIKMLRWYQENPSRTLPETEQAFQTFFGVGIRDLDTKLNHYIDQNTSFQTVLYDVPKIPRPDSYSKSIVSPTEILHRLTELAAESDNHPEAFPQLELQGREGTPDPRIFEVLGGCAFRSGDSAAAREYWNKAQALGSTNPAVDRSLSTLEVESWLHIFNPENEMAVPFVDKMRTRLLRSIKADPEQSAAYVTLAWVEAFSTKPSPENVQVVQNAYNQLHHRDQVTFAFALMLWRAKKIPEAMSLLGQLKDLDPDMRIQNMTEFLKALVENRRPDFQGIKPSQREQILTTTLEDSD